MVKFICDLCGKETNELNTIVIYKKAFQYCKNCNKRAFIIKQAFKREKQEEYLKYEERLKKIEEDFFNKGISRY